MLTHLLHKNEWVKHHLTHYLLSKSLQQHTQNNVYKVAILGVESTGKTTLCKDLAQHFNTQWVVEFTRPYLEHKLATKHLGYEWQDLLIIARGQVALENQMTAIVSRTPRCNTTSNPSGKRFVFCDTSLFELMVYAYWYYGKCPAQIEEMALAHHYDLILLTEIDVPWQADDLRDSPNNRDKIDTALVTALTAHNKPFRRIGGDRQARVGTVAMWLGDL